MRTRHGSAVTRSWRPGGSYSGTAPNTPPPYEGQILAAQSGAFDSRTEGGPASADEIARPRRRHGRVGALSSPGLVVLAALAVVEGYAQLDLVPTGRWRPPVFAVIAVVAAVALTRSAHVGRRPSMRWSVVASAIVVGLVTVAATTVGRPLAAPLLVSVDLLFAATCLGAAMVDEVSALRLPQWGRPRRR